MFKTVCVHALLIVFTYYCLKIPFPYYYCDHHSSFFTHGQLKQHKFHYKEAAFLYIPILYPILPSATATTATQKQQPYHYSPPLLFNTTAYFLPLHIHFVRSQLQALSSSFIATHTHTHRHADTHTQLLFVCVYVCYTDHALLYSQRRTNIKKKRNEEQRKL